MKYAPYLAMLLLAFVSIPTLAHDMPVAYVGLQEHTVGEITVTTKAARRGDLLPRPISLEGAEDMFFGLEDGVVHVSILLALAERDGSCKADSIVSGFENQRRGYE